MLVSMTTLFEACERVLWRDLVPMHYGELTRRALEDLRLEASGREFARAKEDVREKMLEAEQRGTFYLPAPHCYACVRLWFPGEGSLFNQQVEPIIIVGHASWAVDGCAEGLMRRPYLLTKVMDTYERWKAGARGFIIQAHVSNWFCESWPSAWMPPDNEGRWDRPCSHDFKLRIDGRVFNVDVMGPQRDGLFALPSQKSPTQVHIASSISGQDVWIHGYMMGQDFHSTGIFVPDTTRPIARLIVRLNCEKHGVDYAAILNHLNRRNQPCPAAASHR